MKIGTVISTKVIQHRLILEFDLKSCKSAQNHAWLRRWRNVWTHQETCQLGNRDVEIGTFFRRIFCTTVFCSKILFGSLVENAMKKDALPQLWNSPLAKWLGSDVLHEESWTLFLPPGITMDCEKCYFVKEQVLTPYESPQLRYFHAWWCSKTLKQNDEKILGPKICKDWSSQEAVWIWIW